MPFQITCNKCAALLNVDEKNIGKTGKCFKCGNRIEIINPNNDKQNDTLIENKPKRTVRSATEKQKEFARDLGIEFDDNVNMREISKLIDAALAREEALTPEEIELHLKILPKSSPDEMIDEIQRRGLCAFMFLWDPQEAYSQDEFKLNIKFTTNMTVNKVHHMIIQHVMRLCLEYDTTDIIKLNKIIKGN